MEKYIKFSLITLFLISSFKYINTEVCTKTDITETECKANSTCQWTAATAACKGAAACANVAQANCGTTDTGCTFVDADPDTCKTSAGVNCENGFTNQATCEKCHWETTPGKCSEKSSKTGDEPEGDFGSCLKFSGLIGLLSLLF